MLITASRRMVGKKRLTYFCLMFRNMTLANSADPDQMPQNAASDLVLHCLAKTMHQSSNIEMK